MDKSDIREFPGLSFASDGYRSFQRIITTNQDQQKHLSVDGGDVDAQSEPVPTPTSSIILLVPNAFCL